MTKLLIRAGRPSVPLMPCSFVPCLSCSLVLAGSAAPKASTTPSQASLDGKKLTFRGSRVRFGAALQVHPSAMTSMDMGTTFPVFRDIGGGKYQGSAEFAMAGPWRVSVSVTAPGEKPVTKDLDYVVTH